jgi:hypothetical protein
VKDSYSFYHDAQHPHTYFYYYNLGKGTHALKKYLERWKDLYKRSWDIEGAQWNPSLTETELRP